MQELVCEDFDRRMEFCELIEIRGNDFANNIVFFLMKLVSNFMGMLMLKAI